MSFTVAISQCCNICGSKIFLPGHNGRLVGGRPPKCKDCSSMERHRALRNIYRNIPDIFMSNASCIQFSGDNSVRKEWFDKYVISEYGGVNSQNLMDIKYPNETFDWVICNHVLEHVQNDELALHELLRICKSTGIVQLSFPMPHWLPFTKDWGYPDPKDHGHYRYYGADVVGKLLRRSQSKSCLVVVGADPVTGARENAYFLFKETAPMTFLSENLIKSHPIIPIEF